jgi:hypothetical protein
VRWGRRAAGRQPVVVVVDDGHAVDVDAIRVGGEGDRAYAQLRDQFLGRRAPVETNIAPVFDGIPATETLRVRPPTSPPASRAVTSTPASRRK